MFAKVLSNFSWRGVARAGLLTLVVAGFGVVVWWNRELAETPPPEMLPPVATPLDISSVPGRSGPSPPPDVALPYTGEAVERLNADSVFLTQVPAAAYQASLGELADLARHLDDRPRDVEAWMRVAYIKHFYHDEVGARDAYEYLNRIAASHPLAFYNLAVLYGYYLQEPEKAIAKYQAAIQRDPTNVNYYVGFADFYREVLSNLPAALALLQEGLARVPNDVNFAIALGALHAAMGNIAEAQHFYEQALAGDLLGAGERAAIMRAVERLEKSR